MYTLHTYTNLVQIPTLVLSWRSKPLPPIPRDRFDIRLDTGPAFHPTAMHIEADDAISLAILLDTSGDQNDLLKHFDDALAAVAAAHLLPHDHISIYAIGCTLVATARDIPANTATLKSAVISALQTPELYGERGKGCPGALRLRDSLVWIADTLAGSTSRRVVLAITNGNNDKSIKSWDDTKFSLAASGVALFTVRSNSNPSLSTSQLLSTGARTSDEELLRQLCERTGGILLTSSAQDLQSTLTNVIALLRGRYIIEFPRPDDSRPGSHSVDITVPGTHDFIAHTGATVPLPDPSTLTGPNTVPTAKSPATYGNHHPTTPNP